MRQLKRILRCAVCILWPPLALCVVVLAFWGVVLACIYTGIGVILKWVVVILALVFFVFCIVMLWVQLSRECCDFLKRRGWK